MIILKKRIKYLITILMANSILYTNAQSITTSEYEVKAVFLFNFARFIEWPPDSFVSDQEPFVIGVLGKNPFGTYLENVVSGENINGHPLIVRYYQNPNEIKDCQILFINPGETNDLKSILSAVKDKNILTVSDATNFLEQGGMIRFFNKNNKINLQINPDEIKNENLDISSKLLRLAEIFIP